MALSALPWHALPGAEVAARWQTDASRGLSPAQAEERRRRLGENRLRDPPRVPLWRRFLAQLGDFTVLALLLAALIAFLLAVFAPAAGSGPEGPRGVLERFGDPIAILLIVVLNAVLGLFQEYRAERSLAALSELTAPTARVVRDGQPAVLPAQDLVPGDLLLLERGDRVPADLRLLEAADLQIDEAPLTGESGAVHKDPPAQLAPETPLAERTTMAFMGTLVSGGRGRGIVSNTGMHTELGRIAGMLDDLPREPTPLERQLARFGRQIVLACVAVSALVFLCGLLLARQPLKELFLVAVALAVAAIPEGMPAVTTIVLALGMERMARRRALVRRLPAVETLGCAQVICTDKTGTLTQNRMAPRLLFVPSASLRREVPAAGQALPPGPELLPLLRAAAASPGDSPTDSGLRSLAQLYQVPATGRLVAERPFTSERRLSSVVLEEDGARTAYVHGAPEAVLPRCAGLAGPRQEEVLAETAAWAGRAMRVLALARRSMDGDAGADPEQGLELLGLVALHDPPRPEVRAAVQEARAAGVRTMMITGDHPATAHAIAAEVGLWREGDLLLAGAEIDRLDPQQLIERVDRVSVVARATAEHKLRVVEALKARGLVCAMTGDGVNDAPAVKAASIGIAMGRGGTDVTRGEAALVLLDDNYATIVAAVEEGRAIYANIKKFIFFLLSSNTGCVLVVLVASLLGLPSPVLPVQILWINLITNGLPALALGLDGREPEQMKVPPRRAGEPLLSGREYLHILGIGALMAAAALLAYRQALVHGSERAARTLCFAILAVGPLLHAYSCRSRTRSIFGDGLQGLLTNRALLGAVLIGLLLEGATLYLPFLYPVFKTLPLGPTALLWVLGMSLVPVAGVELAKAISRKRQTPSPPPKG